MVEFVLQVAALKPACLECRVEGDRGLLQCPHRNVILGEQFGGVVGVDARIVEDATHELVGFGREGLNGDCIREMIVWPENLNARKVAVDELLKGLGGNLARPVLPGGIGPGDLDDELFWHLRKWRGGGRAWSVGGIRGSSCASSSFQKATD